MDKEWINFKSCIKGGVYVLRKPTFSQPVKDGYFMKHVGPISVSLDNITLHNTSALSSTDTDTNTDIDTDAAILEKWGFRHGRGYASVCGSVSIYTIFLFFSSMLKMQKVNNEKLKIHILP